MKITLSANKNKDIITLPFVQEDALSIDWGSSNNETKDTLKGPMTFVGAPPLASISISSFFPAIRKLPFCEPGTKYPLEYIAWIRGKRDAKKVIRVVITTKNKKTLFNRLMVVESFSVSKVDGAGDYFYDLELTQYKTLKR